MKRPGAIAGQVIAWVALWGAWVAVSRHNHPTLTLNAIASLLLVATFAAAAYANHLWLIPRFRRDRLAYAAILLAMLVGLALACTVAIHLVYDALWGPDPARFGFATNFILEFVLVAFHVASVAAILRAAGWAQRRVAPGRAS